MEALRKKFLGPRPSQRYPSAANVRSQSWSPFDKADEVEDSPGGSLFSESEGDAGQTNRVRPITLRPRQTSTSISRPPVPPKQDPPSSTTKHSISTLSKPSAHLNSSPTHPIKPRKEAPTNSTSSKPNLTTIAVVQKRQPEIPAASQSDSVIKKRKKQQKRTTQNTSARPQTPQTIAPPSENETAQDYVSRYWTAYFAELPTEIRELPSVEKLSWYFRETELLRLENHSLREDEEERRREMVLMGERIVLMNQQVRARDKGV